MDLNILRTVSFLRPLSDEDLGAFASLLSQRTYEVKERILEEGTPVHSFYLVCDGVVHVRRASQKREMLLGRLGVGGFFGEINLFDPGVATASIYAMKPTVVAYVDYESMREFMAKNPSAGYIMVSKMMTEMSRRLRATSARLVSIDYWSSADASLPKDKPS